jgi:hypothetical protein
MAVSTRFENQEVSCLTLQCEFCCLENALVCGDQYDCSEGFRNATIICAAVYTFGFSALAIVWFIVSYKRGLQVK